MPQTRAFEFIVLSRWHFLSQSCKNQIVNTLYREGHVIDNQSRQGNKSLGDWCVWRIIFLGCVSFYSMTRNDIKEIHIIADIYIWSVMFCIIPNVLLGLVYSHKLLTLLIMLEISTYNKFSICFLFSSFYDVISIWWGWYSYVGL